MRFGVLIDSVLCLHTYCCTILFPFCFTAVLIRTPRLPARVVTTTSYWFPIQGTGTISTGAAPGPTDAKQSQVSTQVVWHQTRYRDEWPGF